MHDNRLLIQRAGEALKGGNKRQARALLLQAIRQDARDHVAWLGLARVVPSAQASLDFARRAARLQPDDPLVGKVLAWAERRVVNSQQLTVNNQQLTTSNQQPIVSEQQLTTDDQQPATDNQQPTYHWQTAVMWASIAVIVMILLGIGGVFAWNSLKTRASVADNAPAESGKVMLAQVEQGLPGGGFEEGIGGTAVAIPSIPTATPSPTQPAIQPKNIAEGKEDSAAPRATWTITPTPTNTPTPTPTPVPTFVSPNNSQPAGRPFGVGPNEHWVDVNLSAQTLTAYEGNTLVYSSLISSGLPSWPTVTGQFRIWLRYEAQTMDGSRLGYDYYLTGVPYVMYFYEDYALHGTFWHNNFGNPMSHGCVNMYTPDAQWLFNWSTIGTVVNIHY